MFEDLKSVASQPLPSTDTDLLHPSAYHLSNLVYPTPCVASHSISKPNLLEWKHAIDFGLSRGRPHSMAVVYPGRFLKIAHYFQVSGHSFASRDLPIVTVSMSADESFHSNSFVFVERHKYLKILLVDVAPSKRLLPDQLSFLR